MQKFTSLFVIFFAAVLPLGAQAPLSLEEAMSLAIQHDFGLKSQALRVSMAEKELEKVHARRSPVISGSGDARYNPLLQTVIIPGEAFGQPGEDPQKVRFGTSFNLLFGLDASYKVFDPAHRTNAAIQAAQSGLESLILKKNTVDVKLDAATAFFDMALQQTQVNIAAERLQRARDLLALTQTRLDAGAALPVDLKKSEWEVQNAEALLNQARNNLQRSRLLLARRTGLQPEAFDLPDGVLLLRAGDIEVPAVNPVVVNERYEMMDANQRMEISRFQLQLQDKLYQPALDVYGNISAQHLSDDLALWRRWFPFAFVGLRATVPIFDGNLKALNKESIQYQLLVDRNQIDQLQEELTFELYSAALDVENAVSQFNDAERNITTAREVLQIEETRLGEGALPFAEFRNSEFSLREAETNYLSAARDYLLARLRWMRASGKL